ncbi:MAG: acyl-CoA dehydrogenase family protein [Deltaproteobacteria bacterium]|nr:acyl-CoA dehydrogenase family protein [Deltaproteobacteria bacterium]
MSHSTTETFIQEFPQKLRNVLVENPEIETVNHLEGLPRHFLNKILAQKPLSIFIPYEYGGLGGKPVHCLSLLEAASYESIAVGLMFGINGSLFLEPVAKYGTEKAKAHVFQTFLKNESLGGLMITEPDFGTDALSMRTSFSESDKGYSLKGSKHWGGLTGLADFWLVTARKEKENQNLKRDIDLFIVEKSQPGQKIEVEEYYHKLGLFLIPYGLNKIDVTVPSSSKLIPPTSGLKLMMDLLHRSRLRLSGIGLGFIKRMLDEAIAHCQHRFVGGKNLLGYDQVQHRLSQLQAWYTINSAMCYYTARVSGVKNDLRSFGMQANATKAVLTDMMQCAAQSLLQLTGAKGYRRDHIAGRAVADSRPFQIFEGSNDVMYSQIAEAFLNEMKKKKETNLYTFLSKFELTENIAGYYKHLLNVKLSSKSLQRAKLVLGKIVASLITTEFVLELREAGFRADLVDNAINVVGNTITELMSTLTQLTQIQVIEGYGDRGDWKFLNFNHSD